MNQPVNQVNAANPVLFHFEWNFRLFTTTLLVFILLALGSQLFLSQPRVSNAFLSTKTFPPLKQIMMGLDERFGGQKSLPTLRDKLNMRGVGGQKNLSTQSITPPSGLQTLENYARLPLSFEQNQRQSDSNSLFLARGQGYILHLRPQSAELILNRDSNNHANPVRVSMSFDGGQTNPVLIASQRLPGVVNYLIGSSNKHWFTGIPSYAEIIAEQIYPGINIRYYGSRQQFEYDFIIQPGAQPETIRLAFSGVNTINLDEQGNLQLQTDAGTLTHRKPVIYQEINSQQIAINGYYKIYDTENKTSPRDQRVGFVVADYDKTYPLIIDPVLDFSTYWGGDGEETGLSLAIDHEGNAYVAGITTSLNLPVYGAAQNTQIEGTDAFLFKLNPQGDALLYATYFGGSGDEGETHITLDNAEQVYLTGSTSSNTDFPLHRAIQFVFGGGSTDAYVAKLSTDGTALTYASYLGGQADDSGHGISVNASGEAYITGVTHSTDFPVIAARQKNLNGNNDIFLSKLSTSGSELIFSTYLGGLESDEKQSNEEQVNAIVLDTADNIYLAGWTRSRDFPVTNRAVQTQLAGQSDGFVIKFAPDATSIDYATLLGGTQQDAINAMLVNPDGDITVAGSTYSHEDFPITANALQMLFAGGQTDAFISRINTQNNALVFSSYLGGNKNDQAYGLSIGTQQSIWVAGVTDSTNLPLANPLQIALAGDSDGFITQLDQNATQLIFSSYLGGTKKDSIRAIAADHQGNIYITGATQSNTDFPLFVPLQATYGGSDADAFVVKLFDTSRANEPSILANGLVCTLDIDDNGNSDALTDGLLILRYLFGFAGNVLTGGVIDPQGNRTSTADIEAYLTACRNALDADDNGNSDALTDGLLILRYMFGFSGNVLIDNVVDPQGNRTSPVDIETYLQQLLPSANQAPVITSSPITSATVDNPYQYQIVANDPDNDPLSYTLTDSPLGMSLDDQGLINWLPLNSGTAQVEISVDDKLGGQTTQSFELTTTFAAGAGNLPPELAPIGNQTVFLGSTLTVQLSATDNDLVSYDAEPMPLISGMSLGAMSGVLSFTPTEPGLYHVTLIARDGRFSDSESITITVPETNGITRLSGKVLTTDAAPLANVRMEIAGIETFTDANGNYLLDNLPVFGEVRLLVDGSSVDPDLGVFATVPEIIHLLEGADNILNPAIILLPLDVASADPVDPNTMSIITSSRFTQGLKISEPVTLTIPPGAAIDDSTGLPYEGDIHISRIEDPTQGPRPLPPDIGLSVYIAMQPFGVTYPEPVPISFPNLEDFPPGSRMDFFALNHETGRMEKIGEGLVSADGKTVDSIGGVVKSNSWHGIVPQAPTAAPENDPDNDEPPCPANDPDCCPKQDGCSINQETGNLSEEHAIPSYSSLQQTRGLRLQYNSNKANPQPVIPMLSGFGNQAPPPEAMSLRINVDGVDMGSPAFAKVRVEPSNVRGQFKTTRPALQFDARSLDSGLHDYALEIDCFFPISRRSATVNQQIIVQNEQNSPFGAGWTVVGLQRLYSHPNGKIMISEGNRSALVFTPEQNGEGFRSAAGDYSILSNLPDLGHARRMKDGTVYQFDINGLLISQTDRNGNVTAYEYDAEERLIRIIDPVGKAFELSYFAGRVSTISDPLNRTTRFKHDSEGNLISIIEPNDDTRHFEYESGSHLLTAQLDQRGNRKEYSYDFAGRITQAQLPDGSVIEVQPGVTRGLIDPTGGIGDSRDNLADAPPLSENIENSYTDQNGNVEIASTDTRNVPLQHTDGVGRVTQYQRDTDSNPLQTTRPNKSMTQSEYDGLGNKTLKRELFNGAEYQFNYDAFSLLIAFVNPNMNTTTIERDNTGNATRIVNHLGHTTLINYDSRGLPIRSDEPNGLITTYSYNDQGLLETLTEIPPATSSRTERVTRYSYDAAGQNTQSITPDNVVLDMEYDNKGRLINVIDNLGQRVEYIYDAYNNLIQSETFNAGGDLALTVRQVFDSRNRLIKSLAPHNDTEDAVMQRILDNNSNLIRRIDPNGNNSSSMFDGEDRLIENTHRLDGVTKYEYDTNNHITKVTAPNGVVTEFSYDVLGRRLTETSPDRGTLSYTYDLADNITSITDGRGITVSMSYDELERVKTKTFPNSIDGKDETVTYIYDDCPFGIGQLCNRIDESGSENYEYDVFGNVVVVTHTELGVEYSYSYSYDDGDHVIQATYPSGRVVEYQRDGVRRVEAIDATVNGAPQRIIGTIRYRADKKMALCTFGNGLIDERDYDLQGRLFHQVLKTESDQVIDERDYSFDLNGNILNRTTTPQTSDYDYDALDRIVGDNINGGAPFVYDYDLNGNRRTRDQDTDLDERYSFVEGSNRLSRLSLVTASELLATANDRELVFNDANRLFQLIENGVLIAEYIYNDRGQRTRKILHDPEGGPNTLIVYHYDLMGYLISETDAEGNLIRDYIWTEGMYPMAQIDRVGTTDQVSYLHTDHLMTNRLATNDDAIVIWRWEGEAFGNTPAQEIGGVTVNLRFPGQYVDEESGLYYNWNRYYDPGVGRYITSDPIGFESGEINLYRYGLNNPVRYFDFSGRNITGALTTGLIEYLFSGTQADVECAIKKCRTDKSCINAFQGSEYIDNFELWLKHWAGKQLPPEDRAKVFRDHGKGIKKLIPLIKECKCED